jgi:hypothetical protein
VAGPMPATRRARPDLSDGSGKWAYYQVTSRLVVVPGFADPFHTAVVS